MINKEKEKIGIEIDGVNHIDMANQIDNSWTKDTILSLVNKSENICYSIRLKNGDKSKIKKKFINLNETRSTNRHNKKVINLIFAYLIFKILKEKKEIIKEILICPDHRPTRDVYHYIQMISNLLGEPNLIQEVNISFINRKKYNIKKRTPSHKLAGKILKGRKKANDFANFEELDKIMAKLL